LSLLSLAALVAVQVVIVTVNKVFYWELLRMLMKLGIRHEHLDPNEWVACKRLPNKIREAKRNRRDRFSQGTSRVMVLNLLVRIFTMQGEQHYKAQHCTALHRAGRAHRA
jgi:hypothetical protein